MAFQSAIAEAHPDGHRIDIQWEFDSDTSYTGLRVVRRETTFPVHPDDGVPVDIELATNMNNLYADLELFDNRLYYYCLYPYVNDPPEFDLENVYTVSALVTSPNGYGEYMYNLLPEIYRRYDKDELFLQRFLKITGGQLDQIESFSRFMREIHNVDKTGHELLPALAQWIAWKTDFKREVIQQRQEIKNAPTIYKSIGLLPTVEATVKRISNLNNQTKEYVHNVFASNRPEKFNFWSLQQLGEDVWSETESLVSLDYAYDGKPDWDSDSNGIRWFIYHTERKGNWEIWAKTTPLYRLEQSLGIELLVGTISEDLYNAFVDKDLPVPQTANLSQISLNIWRVDGAADQYIVESHSDYLLAYHLSDNNMALGESFPLVPKDDNKLIFKYPTVANYGNELWLFWSACNEADPRNSFWSIQYKIRSDARFSDIGPLEEAIPDIALNPFVTGGVYDDTIQRRYPNAIVDSNNRLWLFWLEKSSSRWQLHYNRHNGTNWGEPITFPLVGGIDPDVVTDLQVIIEVLSGTPQIGVFWANDAETITPGIIQKQVAYRIKTDINFDDLNWSIIRTIPKSTLDDNHHDREPYPILTDSGLEVFWSSNREDSGWSIWHGHISDLTSNTWDAIQRVSDVDYSQRTPLVMPVFGQSLLIYHSNRHRQYNSPTYRATQTFDRRYSGSTALDVRHMQRIRKFKHINDYQCYTYDTGQDGVRDDSRRIARDTIGVFLQADTYSDEEVSDEIERLRPVVKEFMPITDRAVFIPSLDFHTDFVYTYAQPSSSTPHYIAETYNDEFVSDFTESALEGGEDFSDSLGGTS